MKSWRIDFLLRKSGEGEIQKVEGLDIVARFKWSVGELMEKFIKKFADKKILGAKCPQCGSTYVPPRTRCARCYAEMGEDDLVELSGKGSLESYTRALVELDGKGEFQNLEEPRIIGSVKLEESNTRIVVPIGEADPEEVEPGMNVEVVWRDKTKGEIADMKYFKPAKA